MFLLFIFLKFTRIEKRKIDFTRKENNDIKLLHSRPTIKPQEIILPGISMKDLKFLNTRNKHLQSITRKIGNKIDFPQDEFLKYANIVERLQEENNVLRKELEEESKLCDHLHLQCKLSQTEMDLKKIRKQNKSLQKSCINSSDEMKSESLNKLIN